MFYHSKRHATICLDELHAPVIETGIATSDNDHIVKYPEVKAQFINSTSAMSVNGEDTCISIFATIPTGMYLYQTLKKLLGNRPKNQPQTISYN